MRSLESMVSLTKGKPMVTATLLRARFYRVLEQTARVAEVRQWARAQRRALVAEAWEIRHLLRSES